MLSTVSCPENVGRFGGALNLLGVAILCLNNWKSIILPHLMLVQTCYVCSQPFSPDHLPILEFLSFVVDVLVGPPSSDDVLILDLSVFPDQPHVL